MRAQPIQGPMHGSLRVGQVAPALYEFRYAASSGVVVCDDGAKPSAMIAFYILRCTSNAGGAGLAPYDVAIFLITRGE